MGEEGGVIYNISCTTAALLQWFRDDLTKCNRLQQIDSVR